MSGGVDLVDDAFLYLTESRYPSGCSDTCKRVIKKKAGMFVICEEWFFSKKNKKGKVKMKVKFFVDYIIDF